MALTDIQLLTYLNVKGLGNKTACKIAEEAIRCNVSLSSTKGMFEFFQMLMKKNVISRPNINNVTAINDGYDTAMRTIEQSELKGIKYTTLYSNDFPSKLKDIRDSKGNLDAPLVLWYKGNLEVAEMPSVAIIGTREPTYEGIVAGQHFGYEFSKEGFNIVSGLAYGCDKSAHEGALKAEGKTTAFLANGLDIVYPPEHTELAERIVSSGGLLMSEYQIGTRSIINYFIARDRLQSGLSDACIVIQTGREGGALHAVRATIVNNKPLYAVEFNDEKAIKKPVVQGNLMLLNEGIRVKPSAPFCKALPLNRNNCTDIIKYLKEIKYKQEPTNTNKACNKYVQLDMFNSEF